MDGARARAMVMSVEMGKVVTMTMRMTAMRPQIAPCGDGEPAAKGNECEARDRVDDVAEAFCKSDPPAATRLTRSAVSKGRVRSQPEARPAPFQISTSPVAVRSA
jgi:hypothetical protein